MDCLPPEIIAQILSYLPGIEVVKFKRLHRTFRNTVIEYRDILRCPEIKFSISNQDPDGYNHGQMIRLDFRYGKKHWNLVYEHPKYITIESWRKRIYFAFFGPFFEQHKRIEERTFQTLLDFIFEKVDLAEMNIIGMSNEECILILMERIKQKNPRILSIKTSPSNFSSISICNLMKTVAFQKHRTSEFPTATVVDAEFPEQIIYLEGHLRRINEIAELYKRTVMKSTVSQTGIILKALAESWRKEPFDRFHFDLHVKSYAIIHQYMPPFDIPGIQDNFKMTGINTEIFEYCVLNGRDSIILLEDRDSGHVLRFDKTGIIPPRGVDPILGYPLGTVKISLGVILNIEDS